MSERQWPRKATAFWPVLVVVYVADFITKRLAVAELSPAYVPHEVIGDFLRFTLAYNKYAAMGLSLGDYSRAGFTVTALVVLTVLFVLYAKTPGGDRWPGFALGMIVAGALGNLTDRLMSSMGVVDFIDVGIGASRFYTFNVADAAITCGAVLLAIVSLREGSRGDALDETGGDKSKTGSHQKA